MAVNGGVGNQDTLILCAVGRPDVVQIDVVAQILCQHRAVEGADDGNVQTCGLLQQCLGLCAVLTHDADVVAACFAGPVFLHIQRAELAEAVSGEQHLIAGIVGNNNLGPVDHRCGNEGQGVLAEAQGIALTDDDAAVSVVRAEKLLHHGKSLGRGNHHCFGISSQELMDVCGVVGLHVVDHQIIGLAVFKDGFNITQPFIGKVLVYGVHDGNLFIQNRIGIIGHAVGDNILAFKQVNVMVVDTNVADIVCNGHNRSPFLIL